jgi:FkbM family methyltransferase
MTTLSPYLRFLQKTLMKVRPNILAAKLKNLLGVKRLPFETPQGTFLIDPISLLGIALTTKGLHEEGMVKTLEKFLSRGSCFVDLGANEGYFTIIAARLCGEAGRVISIEPQQRLHAVIKENIRLNKSPNAALVGAAIGDKPGTAVMHLTASTNTGGSGFERRSSYPLPTQEVSMMTLEQLLDAQSASSVDLMKVDIEGFEYEALLGSPKVFEQHRIKALALELHPAILSARGKDSADITGMLTRCGYRCEDTFGNTVWIAPQ